MTAGLVVVALGGNALLQRGEPADITTQRRNTETAAAAVAAIARARPVLVTHGNGPQVGLLALQAAALDEPRAGAHAGDAPTPLDALDAESEGLIGYLLEIALRNALPDREVATLLTAVIVDVDDPAFAHPTKPIGPRYAAEHGAQLASERGWALAAAGTSGTEVRRVVASPAPREVLGLPAIRQLLEGHVLVICAGGGGIPVTRNDDGRLHGIEAVVDKDRTAALLAAALGATDLLLLTDVDAVYADWGTPHATPLRTATPAVLRALTFDAGSMGPKVEAACRFAEETGGRAIIAALGEAAAALAGEAGTSVRAAP